jgi:alpha,alpha-trehalase
MSTISPLAERVSAVRTFITSKWQETVRVHKNDDGSLLGLPHPYTIPCRNGVFQELYYWDTYFTCLGLLDSGEHQLARDNARNLLSQVERFGYVPNGNRTFYLTRSQPPYLAPLVWHIAVTLHDEAFAREAVPLIRREYEFWTTRRMTPAGLSQHGHNATREELIAFFPEMMHRGHLAGKRAEDCLDEVAHLMSECETGWDLNHRFEHRCGDFCPVDLNSTLIIYERFLARFGPAKEKADWLARAETRVKRITELHWNDQQGVFLDYDFRHQRPGKIVSAAAFQPLWAGLATAEQAQRIVENVLPQIELAHGIAACAPGPRDRVCGWDYPNAWPCMQYLVYRGLARYGFEKEAKRVAEKYLATVCNCFESTGDLWEKYNALDGSVRTPSEHGYNESTHRSFEAASTDAMHDAPPAMLGWTAGVFLDADAFLRGKAAPLGHHEVLG